MERVKDLTYITPEEYREGALYLLGEHKRKPGNAKGYRRRYVNAIAAFDIETARIPPELTGLDREQSIMYMWQLSINGVLNIVGRTWEQFQRLVSIIDSELDEGENSMRLCLWVHNLSYEFQFLKGLYPFENSAVFAVESRRILRADLTPRIELRCSYLHSNMGLGQFLDKMHTKHRKQDGGEFDYNAIRYPWTPLDETQIYYGLCDVVGLCEAISAEMEIDGDTLHSIPLTSTGYVRRDIKKAMNKLSRVWLPERLPPLEVYEVLRKAFRGGDTHANRHFSGRVLHDVTSADRSSSYPGVQMNHLFPVGKWQQETNPTPETLERLITKRKRAVVFTARFTGVKLRNRWDGCPYIPRDKCETLAGGFFDNGRVLSADSLVISMTDVDYNITRAQYAWESMEVYALYYSAYGELPEEVKEVIRKYYRLKTELKQDEKSPDFDPVQDALYMKSKNKLNGIYGCSAQDPCKDSILFNGGTYDKAGTPVSELLETAYRHAFFSYAWGVWCTAWARFELHEGINLVQQTPGAEFVYCDTDSVKYLGAVDWSGYNAHKQAVSTASGAIATDPAGITHYMEVYEPDGHYPTFATLGSKKYAFTKPAKSGLFITIAGVTKSKGGAELLRGDKYGTGIERFCLAGEAGKEFLFREAGGTEALYNDNINVFVTVDGHPLRITDNVVIRESTYLLGITDEYSALMQLELLKTETPEIYWASDDGRG